MKYRLNLASIVPWRFMAIGIWIEIYLVVYNFVVHVNQNIMT